MWSRLKGRAPFSRRLSADLLIPAAVATSSKVNPDR